MPRKRHSELVAGVFVVVALVLGLGVVFWLGAADVFKPSKSRAVFFVAESAGSVGLHEGSFVRVNDDAVGKITEIRYVPAEARTLYVAQIERGDIAIRADGKAHVVAGLVGATSLVISYCGSDDKPAADEDHPVEISGGLDRAMSDIAAAAEIIKRELDAGQADRLLAKIHTVLDDMKSAARDVAKITANIRPEMDRTNADSMLAKARSSVEDIKAITTDAKPKISKTLDAAVEAAGRIRDYTKKDIVEILTKLRESNTEILKIAKDFRAVSENAREIVVLNRDKIDEMIDNMAQVSDNLKSTSKEIRRNPWRLIHKPKDEEIRSRDIYDAARAFSSGAEQLDRALARLNALAAYPEGLKADDPQLRKIRAQIEDAFGKFSKVEQALWKELEK